jgi:hypothetical protein
MGASAEASCTIAGLANSWLYVYPSGINPSIPSGAARVRRQEQHSQQAQLAATIDMTNSSGARRLNTPPVHQPFKINCLSPSYWAEPVAWKGGFWAHDTVALISPHLLVLPIRQFLLSGTFQVCVPRKSPGKDLLADLLGFPFGFTYSAIPTQYLHSYPRSRPIRLATAYCPPTCFLGQYPILAFEQFSTIAVLSFYSHNRLLHQWYPTY